MKAGGGLGRGGCTELRDEASLCTHVHVYVGCDFHLSNLSGFGHCTSAAPHFIVFFSNSIFLIQQKVTALNR